MIKKYLIPVLAIFIFFACDKEKDFQEDIFPGYTSTTGDATWIVYTHTVTDVTYLTNFLKNQVPPSTYGKFDTSLVQARQKEVTPYSYKLYINGDVAQIGKSATNENIWIKVADLKWVLDGERMQLLKSVGGNLISVATGFPDQSKLLIRYKRSYFGDVSVDKDKPVMEILYTMFK